MAPLTKASEANPEDLNASSIPIAWKEETDTLKVVL